MRSSLRLLVGKLSLPQATLWESFGAQPSTGLSDLAKTSIMTAAGQVLWKDALASRSLERIGKFTSHGFSPQNASSKHAGYSILRWIAELWWRVPLLVRYSNLEITT